MGRTTFEELLKLQEQLKDHSREYWLQHTFLTWRWWLLFALTLLPWFIWWKIVDKKRIGEILFYGYSIALMTIVLDSIGTNLMWWVYPHMLFRILPPLVPVDLAIIPCLMMVIYQYFKTWKTFLVANTIFAFLASYIGELLFVWIGVYKLITWKYFYSLLFYIGAGTISRWIVIKTRN